MGTKQKAGVKNFDQGLKRLCVASFFSKIYQCVCRRAGETLVSKSVAEVKGQISQSRFRL